MPIGFELARRLGLAVSLPLVCAALAPAQRFALDDGSGRVLQLVNVEDLLGKLDDGQAADSDLQRLAHFLRQHVTPPLGNNHDLKPLGRGSLVLLAQDAHAAWLERTLADARAAKGTSILVESHICEVPDEPFKLLVQRFLQDGATATTAQTAVVSRKDAERLFDALKGTDKCNVLTAPQVLVNPLMAASLQVGSDVSYVKDFEVTTVGGKVVADPIVDTVFDGTRIKLVATRIDQGLTALSYEMLTQTLGRPIPTFVTTLGVGEPISIQLPNTRGQHIQQAVALRDDATALMAAKAGPDRNILVFVSARAVKADPAAEKPRVLR